MPWRGVLRGQLNDQPVGQSGVSKSDANTPRPSVSKKAQAEEHIELLIMKHLKRIGSTSPHALCQVKSVYRPTKANMYRLIYHIPKHPYERREPVGPYNRALTRLRTKMFIDNGEHHGYAVPNGYFLTPAGLSFLSL